MAKDIKKIKEEQLSAIDQKLEKVTTLEDTLKCCSNEVTKWQHVVQSLELKVDDLENGCRRNKLLIYDIQENANEAVQRLETSVRDL